MTKPNDFNQRPTIRLFDKTNEFVEMISQTRANRLLRKSSVELLMVVPPTVRLLIEKSRYKIYDSSLDDPLITPRMNKIYLQKGNLYGNYKVLSPDNKLMFRALHYRILWYLNRGLVDVIDESTVRLKFKPKGIGCVNDEFSISEKENKCVVCGSENELSKHHIIPWCFRKWMDDRFKNWASHDIVLTCLSCHREYEDESEKLKSNFAKENGFEDCNGFYNKITLEKFTPEADKIGKKASALTVFKDQIPESRKQELLNFITQQIGHCPSFQELQNLANKRFTVPISEEYATFGEMLIKKMGKNDLQNFANQWREHFLSTMCPKHMPEKWDVNRSIDYLDWKQS